MLGDNEALKLGLIDGLMLGDADGDMLEDWLGEIDGEKEPALLKSSKNEFDCLAAICNPSISVISVE